MLRRGFANEIPARRKECRRPSRPEIDNTPHHPVNRNLEGLHLVLQVTVLVGRGRARQKADQRAGLGPLAISPNLEIDGVMLILCGPSQVRVEKKHPRRLQAQATKNTTPSALPASRGPAQQDMPRYNRSGSGLRLAVGHRTANVLLGLC